MLHVSFFRIIEKLLKNPTTNMEINEQLISQVKKNNKLKKLYKLLTPRVALPSLDVSPFFFLLSCSFFVALSRYLHSFAKTRLITITRAIINKISTLSVNRTRCASYVTTGLQMR